MTISPPTYKPITYADVARGDRVRLSSTAHNNVMTITVSGHGSRYVETDRNYFSSVDFPIIERELKPAPTVPGVYILPSQQKPSGYLSGVYFLDAGGNWTYTNSGAGAQVINLTRNSIERLSDELVLMTAGA